MLQTVKFLFLLDFAFRHKMHKTDIRNVYEINSKQNCLH